MRRKISSHFGFMDGIIGFGYPYGNNTGCGECIGKDVWNGEEACVIIPYWELHGLEYPKFIGWLPIVKRCGCGTCLRERRILESLLPKFWAEVLTLGRFFIFWKIRIMLYSIFNKYKMLSFNIKEMTRFRKLSVIHYVISCQKVACLTQHSFELIEKIYDT